MDNFEFKNILEKAILGDKHSIEKIIEMYMPTIKKASVDYIKGQVDEDCISTIVENLYKEIIKFKIN
jgi:hypothetical protein